MCSSHRSGQGVFLNNGKKSRSCVECLCNARDRVCRFSYLLNQMFKKRTAWGSSLESSRSTTPSDGRFSRATSVKGSLQDLEGPQFNPNPHFSLLAMYPCVRLQQPYLVALWEKNSYSTKQIRTVLLCDYDIIPATYPCVNHIWWVFGNSFSQAWHNSYLAGREGGRRWCAIVLKCAFSTNII